MSKREDPFLNEIHSWLEQRFVSGLLVDESVPNIPVIEIPDHNLAIHPVSLNPEVSHVPDEFIRMSDQYASKHYTLVHLWEDIWRAKNEIARSRVESLMGETNRIHARETKVDRVDQLQVDSFLEKNHLIGTAKGKYKYGLFRRGELVAVATFGSVLKVEREGEPFRSYEMIRYCNKCGATVVGGLSKLIKAFSRENDPDDIVTSTDRDWSRGRGFRRLRFELMGATPAQFFYVDPKTYERHWIHRPPFDVEDGATNENIKWEYLKRGYLEVFNTGNLKFIRYYK